MDFSKPRVAIYYFVVPETGYRNDGPPLFLNYALRKILNGKAKMSDDSGNVVHLWPSKDYANFGTFDLNILPDHGEDAIGVGLDWEIPHPNAYWVSDAHIGYKYRLDRAKQFDFVFCCQRRALEEFARDGIPREKLFWLPHCVEPDCYKPYASIEKWDWAFIGHLNSEHRVDLLDRFCKEFPSWYLGWRQPQAKGWNVLDDAARKFSQAKLIVSDSIKDDLQMRTFEALACKRCLITSDISEFLGVFENRKHLVTYKSIDEAVSLAKELLADDVLRNSIAEEGYKEVISKHTYKHRALEILEKTIGYKPKEEIHATVEIGTAS